FDQKDAKGNALFMLDAYSGDVVWKASKTGSGADTDSMKYSFAATPVFYAKMGGSFPYIAGVVAADHGGQIWHIPTPGPAALSSGTYSFTPEITFRAISPLIAT